MGSAEQPLTHVYEREVAAVSAASDLTTVLAEIQEDGVVSKVEYVPVSAVTGTNTSTRTIAVVNKGQSGSGSTTVASLALTSGHNLAAGDNNTITLSTTSNALTVTAGDVLEWTSTHASGGLADPGGLVHVETTRS